MNRLFHLLSFLFLLALPLRAADITASAATRAAIETAIATAVDGDTVIIPANAAAIIPWTATTTIAKAITLQGQGIGATIVMDDINVASAQMIKWQTTAGKSYRMTDIEFRRALRNVTGVAATDLITCTAHTLTVLDRIIFQSSTTQDPDDVALVGGAGIAPSTSYYVKTTPTADTFTISATSGGATLDFTTDITAGQWRRYRILEDGCFTVTGNSSAMRIDNCRFYNLEDEAFYWYDAYGVIDSCDFTSDTNGRLVMFNHRSIFGSTSTNGDASWTNPVDWGGPGALYIEDCTLTRHSVNGSIHRNISDCIKGGGRMVVRRCTFSKTGVGNHGTESSQRFRGGRSIELYDNTFDSVYSPASTVDAVVHWRSGTGLAFNNKFTGTFNNVLKLSSYRTKGSASPWGLGDGTWPWDIPDLTDGAGTPGGAGDGVFETGTLTAAASGSATDSAKAWTTDQWDNYHIRTLALLTATSGTTGTVTVSGATWTTNEWAGYDFTKTSDGAKGIVSTNTGTVLTLSTSYNRPSMSGGGAFTLSKSGWITANTGTVLTISESIEGTPRVLKSGMAYEIRKVDKVLDDSGLGITDPVLGSPAIPGAVNQQLDPCYQWLNLRRVNSGTAWGSATMAAWGAGSYPSIKANRNYYNETVGFNGTVGVGVGTLAARPATCTTGVGYWATDQGEWNSTNGATADGQLYVATATNTWGLHYRPYTYPHPLVLPEAPDTTAPTVFSATIENNGATLTLVFTEDVVGVNAANYTVTSCTLGTAVGSGPTCTIPLSPTVLLGATPTLGYTAGTTVDTAASPNPLANFSGMAITNNSIQTALSVPGRLRNLQILIQ